MYVRGHFYMYGDRDEDSCIDSDITSKYCTSIPDQVMLVTGR